MRMREIFPVNYGWDYIENFTPDFACGGKADCETVDLPHSCAVTPLDFFDERIYQTDCGYRKTIHIPESAKDKKIFLTVGAAAHSAQVYVNGKPCGERHNCGYTSFTRELTDLLTPGQTALLCIEVDSRETQNIPPFGNVIDYMTYGGIYREVRLEIRDKCHLSDIFPMPEISGRLAVQCKAEGSPDSIVHSLYLGGKKIVTVVSDRARGIPLSPARVWA